MPVGQPQSTQPSLPTHTDARSDIALIASLSPPIDLGLQAFRLLRRWKLAITRIDLVICTLGKASWNEVCGTHLLSKTFGKSRRVVWSTGALRNPLRKRLSGLVLIVFGSTLPYLLRPFPLHHSSISTFDRLFLVPPSDP
ncbi:hypothetical protein AB1N83_011237 [Pleurotus pulmonarius]